MSEFNETINERIAEVKEDLALQANYDLTEDQIDELRLSGRTCISMVKFAPYVKKVSAFLNLCRADDNDEVVWDLSLNTVSGDFEISLKGCHMNF
jgi:hypothetical protein